MEILKFNELVSPLVKFKKLGTGSGGEYTNANPKIIILHPPKPCEDCDELTEGRTVSYIVKNGQWVKKCEECRRKYRVSNPANDWGHK
jgi:hypothetical protein